MFRSDGEPALSLVPWSIDSLFARLLLIAILGGIVSLHCQPSPIATDRLQLGFKPFGHLISLHHLSSISPLVRFRQYRSDRTFLDSAIYLGHVIAYVYIMIDLPMISPLTK
jgi:hypothetical protein